jgi:hypothetical protein
MSFEFSTSNIIMYSTNTFFGDTIFSIRFFSNDALAYLRPVFSLQFRYFKFGIFVCVRTHSLLSQFKSMQFSFASICTGTRDIPFGSDYLKSYIILRCCYIFHFGVAKTLYADETFIRSGTHLRNYKKKDKTIKTIVVSRMWCDSCNVHASSNGEISNSDDFEIWVLN